MKLFDSHCHLNAIDLVSGLGGFIDDARQQGVNRWLIPATSPDQWSEIYNLSKSYSGIQAALGIHPWYVDQYPLSTLDAVSHLVALYPDIIVAIGETGLDSFRPNYPQQILHFEAQLKLATQLQLPVIIHCVKAQDDVVLCLKRNKVSSGVIHGFTGSYQQAMQLSELGLKIGVGGSITYERAKKTRNAISKIPLESLVLETDAPAMPLSGYQGAVNEPSRLSMVFDTLVDLRAESAGTIEAQLWKNTMALFGGNRVKQN